MKVYTDGKLPVKSWASTIEDGALEQARNLANHPIAQLHIALMPDAHQGYGMPIGGVLFAANAIVPNAVGVDIGCGVALLKTTLTADDVADKKKLSRALDLVAKEIPAGFRVHSRPLSESAALVTMNYSEVPDTVPDRFWMDSLASLGTLGGGNHFIEFQQGDTGTVYVMLHSGSRGLGKKLADNYDAMAKKECERWHSDLPSPDLAFFPLGSSGFDKYMEAMKFALAYAEANRNLMLDVVASIISDVWDSGSTMVMANIHHNFAAWEQHRGKNGIVHRKGAIPAREGDIVLIPGSMGTASYIGRGLGNPEAFETCQHGAGRAMGRKAAERLYDAAHLAGVMGVAGVIMAGHASEAIDEHPLAYKNIETVMDDSAELVEKVERLVPLGVVKG
jgi:tRNA-splicing ligase RtcB